MPPDIVDLKAFYETPLGRTTRRAIRRSLAPLWPGRAGLATLGVGYAVPYLRLNEDPARVCAVTTPDHGAAYWPDDGANLVTLADTAELPFADCTFDCIVVVHGLETSAEPSQMLQELWRVLAGSGRLIVAAPNRSGVWSRTERTPFGHGNPYSVTQLSHLLRDHMFVPERTARCLYFPPTPSRVVLAAASAWEEAGKRWFPSLGGLTIVEASKQVYAVTGRKTRRRRYFQIPVPVMAQT